MSSLATIEREGFLSLIDELDYAFQTIRQHRIHPQKKLFLARIVSLAHTLGISVIAEGIETEKEFLTCREIGCNLAQGYFVQINPGL